MFTVIILYVLLIQEVLEEEWKLHGMRISHLHKTKQHKKQLKPMWQSDATKHTNPSTYLTNRHH